MRYRSPIAILLGLLLLAIPAQASAGPRIGDFADALSAIQQARHTIMLSAYTLSAKKQTRLIGALRDAAARGVHVHVVLTSDGYGYAVTQNRALAASAPGFEVQLLSRPLHLKSLVIDGGSVVALSDENFSRCGKILFLDSAYALPIERAALGDPHDAGVLFLTKAHALAFEAAIIDRSHRSVSVETESFGPNDAVATALANALRRGVSVSLRVNGREADDTPDEQDEIAQLRRAGALISYQSGTAKGAVIDNIGYFGSANATQGLDDQVDFGFASEDPIFVSSMRAQFTQTGYCR